MLGNLRKEIRNGNNLERGWDAILDGETGLLVDGQSIEEIAGACIRLLGDPMLAETIGKAGLAHSAENTWPRQAGRFLELCRGLCGQLEGR